MFRAIFSMLLILTLITGISSCSDEDQEIIPLETDDPPVMPVKHDARDVVRIAVGGMITPKEGIAYYRDLLRYIGEKIGRKVEYVDRESYAEINDMLKAGELEAAFVCSGPYVDGKRDFNLELLVAPQAYGKSVYYSYIIVAKESQYRSLEELRGKKFAFTDPLSNTGKLAPSYMLAKINETPATFFSEVIFTKSHDKSIKAVAQGIVDGAAVDSLIWEYLNSINNELTSKTRIIKKSTPFAIPPVAVPEDLSQELKSKLKQVLLDADSDPQGRQILKKMKIDKFVVLEDSAYDSVREMQNWVEK